MAQTMELETLKNELTRTDITQNELEKMAKDRSTEILQKIEKTTEGIKNAKDAANAAKDMKAGWFGKTRKKTDATANAVVATNEALSEMNNLVQESIRYTCSSIQFAQVMHKTMAYMMVHGFNDANGKIKTLSEDSKEAVQLIVDEAEDFVAKQLAVEEKQEEMNQQIDESRGNIEKNAADIARSKEGIETNALKIAENAKSIEANASKIDDNRGNIRKNAVDIAENAKGIEANVLRIGENKTSIVANAEKIDQLQALLQQSISRIEKLEKLSTANKGIIVVLIIFAAISLSIGCVSLFFHMLNK